MDDKLSVVPVPINPLATSEGRDEGDIETSTYVNPVSVRATATDKEEEKEAVVVVEAPVVVRLDEMDMCEISSVNTDHHFCWDPRTVL